MVLLAGTPMDPEHAEARYTALQSLLQEHVKYGWMVNLVCLPIHWYRIGPRLHIPPEREMEALAVQLIVMVLFCLDTTFKLGRAEQVDPMLTLIWTRVTCAWLKSLMLKCDDPLSNSSFDFNLRRYSWASSHGTRRSASR
jgi:hypothetical protein